MAPAPHVKVLVKSAKWTAIKSFQTPNFLLKRAGLRHLVSIKNPGFSTKLRKSCRHNNLRCTPQLPISTKNSLSFYSTGTRTWNLGPWTHKNALKAYCILWVAMPKILPRQLNAGHKDSCTKKLAQAARATASKKKRCTLKLVNNTSANSPLWTCKRCKIGALNCLKCSTSKRCL